MTDIRFFELCEKRCKQSGNTLLEFNSTHRIMLCHSSEFDGLLLYHLNDNDVREENHTWHCLRGAPNTNEGFQYIMDLYQMFITNHLDYKKR